MNNAASPVYNIEVRNQHVYQIGNLALLVHNACNLNSNTAVAEFGVHEIVIHGNLHKVGKAHLGRITKRSGLPTRLHQQLRDLKKIFGDDNVTGEVVQNLGETTTELAKMAERTRIKNIFDSTGFIPLGNIKSFK